MRRTGSSRGDALPRRHADRFEFYIDHNNLIFLLDPSSVVPDLSQTSLRKVIRWAVRLSMYKYTCFHIWSTDNVWADLLGRWFAPTTVRRLVRKLELPFSSAKHFEWPNAPVIVAVQAAAGSARPTNLTQVDTIWRNRKNAIWVPNSASDL